jgi:predicted nuclease of predicted toxin-antitoxin system
MIKLYFDEDIPEGITLGLRLRGYDVRTARESGRKGLSDREQIEYAASQQRVIFSHNVADFAKIHRDVLKMGDDHHGMILSKQLPVGEIVRALSRLLSHLKEEDMKNRVIWLSDSMR